jgi:HAD superfamily hydrolase (TIGR01509 family)
MRQISENAIHGIIFDMDGVLCDSEPFISEAGRKMLAERYGLKVKPEDFTPFIGAGEDRFLGGPAEKYGVRINLPADKDRTYEIYLEIIKGKLKPLAGVRNFIAKCRARKIKLAVATSADKIKMNGNLLEIGISPESFDALVCGNEVLRKKPAPEIFLLAAKKINLAPGNCLVIEDAPNGLKAAKSARMRAIGLTTSFKDNVLKSAGADWTAPDLTNLPKLPF